MGFGNEAFASFQGGRYAFLNHAISGTLRRAGRGLRDDLRANGAERLNGRSRSSHYATDKRLAISGGRRHSTNPECV